MLNLRRLKNIVAFIVVGITVLTLTPFTRAQDIPGRYTGSKLLLQGQVMDTGGAALPGVVVEIWQTDANGNYNHPADADPSVLLADFQYFGTATTDANGEYAFLTLKPAPYEPRPAHIHFKVKLNGATLLTSQFYFAEDRAEVEADGAFGGAGDTLFLQTAADVDSDLADDGYRIAAGNIVLDLNGSAADAVTPTAAQTEGPYYPVMDFSGYDNNLISTSENDEIARPAHQAGDFPIGEELTIAALRQQVITGSPITIEQTLENGVGYSQYIASYISEGHRIYGLLTVPFGDPPPGGFKAIVFNHGFIPPDSYRTTERYVAYVGTLASHGFVVFKIDLRGHGNSEGEATGSYYSPGYTIDAIAAFKSLQTLDYVDPQGIGMWGHSMAGNLVMRAMLVEPGIKAGVIWAGAVYSYDDFVQYRINDPQRQPTSGSDPTPSRRRSRALIALYGEPNSARPFWQAVSLTANIGYLQAPVQLHHAANDTVVNIGYSIDLAAVLAQNNKLFEFYRYDGGGHDIDSPYFEDAMLRTLAFFQKHL
jgi:alpha-beta hydrolase superfamily lysophospholipase